VALVKEGGLRKCRSKPKMGVGLPVQSLSWAPCPVFGYQQSTLKQNPFYWVLHNVGLSMFKSSLKMYPNTHNHHKTRKEVSFGKPKFLLVTYFPTNLVYLFTLRGTDIATRKQLVSN